MNKKLILFLLCALPLLSLAQRWKKQRHELVGAFGATNFLGDLGGANREGTHFVRDLDFILTRPFVSGGVSLQNSRKYGCKKQFALGNSFGK